MKTLSNNALSGSKVAFFIDRGDKTTNHSYIFTIKRTYSITLHTLKIRSEMFYMNYYQIQGQVWGKTFHFE